MSAASSARSIVDMKFDPEGTLFVALDDGTVLYHRQLRTEFRLLESGRITRLQLEASRWVTLPPIPGTAAFYMSEFERALAPDTGEL